jgi:type VI protein secretion system component VasF
MTTKADADKMRAQIRTAMVRVESAADALSDAREVMRDAAALIAAMADELAERAES